MANPSLKLVYHCDFQGMGRAEPIRLALSIGDVPFEDVRMSSPEFGKAKASGKFPMGSLPVLEVDGKAVCQSKAIMHYASKLAGVYPKDAFTAMKVEEVSGCIEDVNALVYSTFAITVLDEKIAARKTLVEGQMEEKLQALNNILETNGKKLSASDEISCADVELYVFKKIVSAGILDGIPIDLLDKYPKIVASFEAVAAHPAVVKWNAGHPPKIKGMVHTEL